ncbi:Crp/Fnr family transcriptional regulator [Listeria booriae]|uniref:Crp/Fnr family transcriptional regulator n=1 Tax=Listeria booriae TaxID=1552123 RepID=A0A7X0XLR2_9LIST|nr:Crp/Fnr family transcriptional regulator [Listeria booriae]MBC1211199.1 Crp/Fnr family transcriptional regulator [Listeria booriae]MBC1228520.1 Crp/Fnr family transcriptional regulator [Listeria booriae]MBC1231043.1 Crp/Fnr family transcriptional regulator [Listeria booriae]MBC1235012.1 Crp/Fnr family transcriptional regulator [Listeria booriae]MBC1247025.1 Crp/Fnr family transcriptional regulator [Listeria booriae]
MNDVNVMKLAKGDVVKETGAYVVLSGYLLCKASQNLVHFVQAGDIFIAGDNFCSGVFYYEAKGDVRLALIENTTTWGSLEIQKREFLTRQNMHLLIKRVDFFSLSVKRRLMALLYQAGTEIGVVHDNLCELPTIMTQQEVAEYVNCTREYLSGLRRTLVNEGLLAKKNSWVLQNWSTWEEEFEGSLKERQAEMQ